MREPITVLLTSCGGLVLPGMVECLRSEEQYRFRVVGVDAQADSLGAAFVDRFLSVPQGADPDYAARLLEIARAEGVDVIVPLSDEEAVALSRHKGEFARAGVAVACPDVPAAEIASDKRELLRYLSARGVPTPEFRTPMSLEELDRAVEELGYPLRPVVLKPARSRGARGFWVLTEGENGQDLLLQERNLQRLPYRIVRPLLAERPTLPPLLVMQYLAGPDFNVDVLAQGGRTLYCIPIQRLVPRAGPVQVGRVTHDAAVAAMTSRIVEAFGFSSNINVELAYPGVDRNGEPLVYEVNPRVSAPIAAHRAAGANLLLFGILLALGRPFPTDLPYREVTMFRCWQEIYRLESPVRESTFFRTGVSWRE